MAASLSWLFIFLIAALYASISLSLNKLLGIRARTKQIQKEMQDYQKDVNDALKANDEKRMTAIQETRGKEVNGMMMEMMILPWKSLIIILPIFFLFIGTKGFLGIQYEGIVNDLFPGFEIFLPFDIHINAIFSLSILKTALYGSRGYFIVCTLVSGMLAEAILSRIEAQAKPKDEKPKEAAPAAPSQPPVIASATGAANSPTQGPTAPTGQNPL